MLEFYDFLILLLIPARRAVHVLVTRPGSHVLCTLSQEKAVFFLPRRRHQYSSFICVTSQARDRI